MPRSSVPLLFVILVVCAAAPSSAHAATCGDYANQAQAQRAKDTRDADGDGLYCESLPCPCLKPGQNSGGSTSSPRPRSRPTPKAFVPGRSLSFAKRTRSRNCHVDGFLPDARCTPGAYFKNPDRAHVCTSGYSASVRNVSQALKDKVFAEYEVTAHSGKTYEVDHLVPLELGGSNSIAAASAFIRSLTSAIDNPYPDRIEQHVGAQTALLVRLTADDPADGNTLTGRVFQRIQRIRAAANNDAGLLLTLIAIRDAAFMSHDWLAKRATEEQLRALDAVLEAELASEQQLQVLRQHVAEARAARA